MIDDWPDADEVIASAAPRGFDPHAIADILPPPLCEDALALEFSRVHGNDWRYVSGWSRWMGWDGKRWAKEDTLQVFDLARRVCRDVDARNAKNDGTTRGVKAATVANVERLARADRRHASKSDQWDNDLWTLNTPGGIVDLRTGGIRPHDRTRLMSKITAATPQGLCPVWDSFLRDVTDGDDELAHYLARVAGYALTGVTTEHALFFFYGTGGNGKSIFLSTLAAILGDYSTTAAMDTFLASKSDRHPTDLAGLQGARAVTCGEVEQGRRWAEAKVKEITGGGKISARLMRQDFFEFTPQFKLLAAGNNKPAIFDVDQGIRRRMHLIPFTVTIPADKRDPDLAVKLLAEADGIMAWALRGCMEWQADGLTPPSIVVSATEEYLSGEDSIARWIHECCIKSPQAKTLSATLFASWKTWAELNGEFVGSAKKFGQSLQKHGLKPYRTNSNSGFAGICMKGEAVQEDMPTYTDLDSPEYDN